MVIFQVAFTAAPRSPPLPHSHYLMGMQARIALGAVSAIRWSLNVCKVQKDPAPQCACRALSND